MGAGTGLKGPAAQDLLLDVLLSALYGQHLALRKSALAEHWLCCRAHWQYDRRTGRGGGSKGGPAKTRHGDETQEEARQSRPTCKCNQGTQRLEPW